jgi:xylulokinase
MLMLSQVPLGTSAGKRQPLEGTLGTSRPVTDEAVLGVDIGTSSSKGVLVSLDGRLLATAIRHHAVERPAPGQVEMDAELWWSEFAAISRELTDAGDTRVLAVGVSGMGPCVLLADEDGTALRPAILYGVDTRAEQQIEALTAKYTDAEIAARCGSTLSSQAVGPKLAWLADNEPDVFSHARKLFMPSSWLVYRLTGEYVLDHHSASQSTPLYDTNAHAWYEPWCRDIAPQLALPTLLWSGELAGAIHTVAARETGLDEGTPVIAGTIDAWAEAISVDAHNPGDLMLMYGSTMFLVHTLETTLRSPTLWSTVGVYPETRNLAGGMATSGSITAWLKELFGEVDYADLLAAAEASGPGAAGLLMLPYFAGERTPIADPSARGVIAGLTLSHTQGDIYRAALESIAMGVRHNIEAMEDAGAQIDRVVAVGGGTQGRLWTQIVSDVTGRDQQVPTYTIGASYGAAYLAACSIGSPSISDWNPVAETVQPVEQDAQRYEDLYGLYRELYPATERIAHALSALQHQPRLSGATSAEKGSLRS